ncbi:glycosyltransferase family 4 protein [Desulfolutivibrio sp.]|uniref:glycosyltransferase family 4 protein n=1 Tax=Desulfolutivibrio sp. TaxID=2773296 RepID=UPI002F96B3E6
MARPAKGRLLFAARDLFPAVGGASLSMVPLLRALARAGYDVTSVNAQRPDGQSHTVDGEPFSASVVRDFTAEAAGIMDRMRPDLVITQGWGGTEVLECAFARNLRTCLFVVDLIGYAPQECFEGCRIDHAANLNALKRADMVVANSVYMKRRLRELSGIRAEVVFPIIEEKDYQATSIPSASPRMFVTLASGLAHKGVDMFLEQAPRLGRPCLICGPLAPGRETRLAACRNVRHVGYASDMRPIYAHTACLVVASLFEETFGRVIVEANLNGIPVAALDRGACRETLGRGGVLFSAPEELPGAVREALGVPPKICQDNARRFASAPQIEKALALVADMLLRPQPTRTIP